MNKQVPQSYMWLETSSDIKWRQNSPDTLRDMSDVRYSTTVAFGSSLSLLSSVDLGLCLDCVFISMMFIGYPLALSASVTCYLSSSLSPTVLHTFSALQKRVLATDTLCDKGRW